MKLYDVEVEPLVISKSLIDLFLKNENVSDLIALYTFYYYTAKWQHTNTAKATTYYTAQGLHWSEVRVKKIKKILLGMGLIEDYVHKENGTIKGHFIYVRFVWSDNKVREIQECIKSQRPTRKVLQGVGNIPPNALSVNKVNALNNNKGGINTFLTLFPTSYQQEPLFVKTWENFVVDRKERKAPLTERAVQLIVNKFRENCRADVIWAVECLEASIENGYRGVFIKNKQTSNRVTPTKNEETKPVRRGPRVGCDPHGRD